MMSPAETRECRDKLDALAANAEAKIGLVEIASVQLSRRDQYGYRDQDSVAAVVIFRPVRIDQNTTRTPQSIWARGACAYSAIEAAHREIARRVLEETESAA